MPDPLITVVIPVRDRVELLERSVGSALNQSVTAAEIIVVDDGSTDDIAAAVEAFGDPRLQYIRQDACGPAAARNRGVFAGTAPVLTFLDSDDRARPEWLASLLDLLDDDSCGLASVAGERRDPAGEVTIVGPAVVVPGSPVVAYLAGLFAVRRAVFDAAGGYDTALAFGENSDLVTRLLETCVFQGLRVATSEETLIEIVETRGVDRYDEARLGAAEHLLARDAARLSVQPARRAQLAAIASVNAMRLGRSSQARRHALTALRAEPTRLQHYRRVAVACLGPGPGRLMTSRRRPIS